MAKGFHRRKRSNDVVLTWTTFFRCTLSVVLTCVLFSMLRLLLRDTIQPVRLLESLSGESPPGIESSFSVREIVVLPDHALVFLNYQTPASLYAGENLACVYYNTSTAERGFRRPPIFVEEGESAAGEQIVRCALPPRGFMLSVDLRQRNEGESVSIERPAYRWDSLTYDALIDKDNTTVVFVKGLNLKAEKLSDASKFECVYGWDFSKAPKFVLRSEVVSIAQEIVRCKTPRSILAGKSSVIDSVKVSVRIKGHRTPLNSIARPKSRTRLGFKTEKPDKLCVCTMVRNQARFLKEWVMYHSEIGVQRWFIYDNNSDDDLDSVVRSLGNYSVTRHVWPWVKAQEAGFSHCALRARGQCEWVAFIDVDEFVHVPDDGWNLLDVLADHDGPRVGELRTSCHSFGPSGLTRMPAQGVTVGYTCRIGVPERHKSVVRPGALNASLVNVVHHFHLKDGFRYVNVDRSLAVVNHYKYQVWEVFKEKFYRRVATYVADWRDEQNVGSKDRAPGLGTRPVEPPNWSSQFCEVNDTGLRDRVLRKFLDPLTGLLPWQDRKNGGDEKP